MRKSFIEINAEFENALHIMESTTKHLFLTGKAGTGKSTLLEYFRLNTRKEIAVLAPTGVAALNVDGQTIHSFFGFKPSITPEKVKRISGPDAAIYKEFDTIVIDEISMVRADLLDCIEKFMRLNGPYKKQWFGGVQMIFIGDLYQLPPVVSGAEREIFSHRYESPYFFSAQVFKENSFSLEFIELEKVYRQTEQDFIDLLNGIRNRTCTEDDIERLNCNCRPDAKHPADGFYITLTSTNELANKRNLEMLESLPGREFSLVGKMSGVFERSSLPAEETLTLKPSCQIMLVNNDKFGRWVNGTLGIVKGLSKVDGEDDRVIVKLDNGNTVEVVPNVWELFEYQYDRTTKNISTRTTGTFTQYPIRLAWAVTVHKSQGKTFDRVMIDMGRGAFAHGQVYVALSRCTNFAGVILTKKIQKGHIRMDWRVAKFLTMVQYKKAAEISGYDERCLLIRDAIRRDLKLEIVYLKPNDTKSKRIILPLAIEPMEFKGKQFEGLRAHCTLRNEERHFRIDRILEISYSS